MINFDGDALDRYPTEDRGGPVVMLNLVYQEFEHLRTEALIESVLQPTTPPG